MSNEKNNYTKLQETILFSIDGDGRIQQCGTTSKRDREYVIGTEQPTAQPKRDDCKEIIMQMLDEAGGAMKTAELENSMQDAGYSHATIKRAKDYLKANGKIKYYSTGSKRDKIWYTQKIGDDTFTKFDENFTGPWSESE